MESKKVPLAHNNAKTKMGKMAKKYKGAAKKGY